MQGLEALLGELMRVFAPGAAGTPIAWLVAAGVLALAVAASLIVWRRRGHRNEVEQLFLASVAATRREREISEIDDFARRASASAEELKGRIRKIRAGHFLQVKVYIDHSNFIRTWTEVVHGRERPLGHDVNWAALPQVLIGETNEWLAKARKGPQPLVYRGTNVYGTLFQDDYFTLLESMLRLEQTAPDKLPLPIRLRKETVERWREENATHKAELMRTIQQELGYLVVPIFRRTPREDHLLSSNFTAGGIPIAPEKMLDTHIATDLIGDATFDVYDIALLVSEDSDFIPAVDFVQEMRGKHVIHVGFGGHMNDLRSKCRHRIDLRRDRVFRRVQRVGNDTGGSGNGPGAAARSPAGKRQGGAPS